MIFFNEKKKKNEKDSDNFWQRKLTLKIQFWYFLPLRQFTKYNIFLWVCWFLTKIIFYVVSLSGNLDNQYYHSMSRPIFQMQDTRGRILQEPWKKWEEENLMNIHFCSHLQIWNSNSWVDACSSSLLLLFTDLNSLLKIVIYDLKLKNVFYQCKTLNV